MSSRSLDQPSGAARVVVVAAFCLGTADDRPDWRRNTLERKRSSRVGHTIVEQKSIGVVCVRKGVYCLRVWVTVTASCEQEVPLVGLVDSSWLNYSLLYIILLAETGRLLTRMNLGLTLRLIGAN